MKLFKVVETAYENFDVTIKRYLMKTFDLIGLEYTHNQVFGIIYDGIKAIMQNVMFYIEDAFSELNIYTATRKKSLYNLAKLSGYEPFMGCAATGTVILKPKINSAVTTVNGSAKIYIQNGSHIYSTIGGTQYIMMLPAERYIVDTSKALTTHEVKIVEGGWQASTFTSYGYNNETFNVYSNKLFDRNYIEVYVDGVKWEECANIYEMTENSKTYVISIGYDSKFDVTFGNGVFGKKLIEGQTILVRFIQHSGTIGNVPSNSISGFTFYDTGYDTEGNEVNLNDYINILSTGYITGGMDEDSIVNLRLMIGYNSRSLVLANENNFKLFFNRFSFISKSNIWSELNSMNIYALLVSSDSVVSSASDYLALTEDAFIVPDEKKDMVLSALENSKKMFAGVTLKFVDPIVRRYACLCYLKVNDIYQRESIKNSITNIICNYFMNLDSNVTFISRSEIINKILNNVSNIDAIDLVFISKLEEDCYKTGYYYTYELKYINNTFVYQSTQINYEYGVTPGLDKFGNIELDSKLEIPMLDGGFQYFSDKTNAYDSSTLEAITTQALQFIFV